MVLQQNISHIKRIRHRRNVCLECITIGIKTEDRQKMWPNLVIRPKKVADGPSGTS